MNEVSQMRPVTVRTGDMMKSEAQTLVNTVNTVGVMGKGVALTFKQLFPDMYKDYVDLCSRGKVKLGEPYLYKRLIHPWILNFPTKEHWRSVARLDDIIRGLQYLKQHYREWGITSLAVPPLGCGQGGLEWRVVGPILYKNLAELGIPVDLYAPFGTPHEELQLAGSAPGPPSKVEPSAVALVDILRRIQARPYHWPVGRTTFQKIAYFATEMGIPTGLEYVAASYGPWAPGLKHMVSVLVNNGLITEEPSYNMLMLKVGPTFEAARRSYADDLARWNGIADTVADLFLRMPTRRAEIAATVYFIFKQLGERAGRCPTDDEVLSGVLHWKQRRRPPLNEREVLDMIRTLTLLGWIDVKLTGTLADSEDAEIAAEA
jgi:O-acetyl-ADP-ribose deacetylase (regulator of RNase III)